MPSAKSFVLRRFASPQQCRAGRALLGLTQAEFARRAHVSRRTLSDYESGGIAIAPQALRRITDAFAAGGIVLVAPNGVRLARRRTKRLVADSGRMGAVRLLQALGLLPAVDMAVIWDTCAAVRPESATDGSAVRRVVH